MPRSAVSLPGTYCSARYASIGFEVDLPGDLRQPQQRLQLRRKRQRAVGQPRPEQRLLAEPVTGEDEALASGVPERHREHAVQPLDEVRPALLVEVRQDRCVARAANLVPTQLVAKRHEVVGLAVEHGDDVAPLVRHRLVAGLEVDDLQPLVTEHAVAEGVRRSLVRPALDERGAHGVHELGIRRARGRIESGDAAHGTHTARAVRGRLVSCGASAGRRRLETLQRAPGAQARRVRDRCPHAPAGGGRERGPLARAGAGGSGAGALRAAHALDRAGSRAADRG